MTLTLILSFSSITAYAYENECAIEVNGINFTYDETNDLYISEPLSSSETVEFYAISNGVSYAEAIKELGFTLNDMSRSGNGQRILSVNLPVTNKYIPRLDFYCHTSEGGNFWGIVDIYSIQLVRKYENLVKNFNGDIEVWLRSPYQIEYIVNGNFYDVGTTTTTAGGNVGVGIGDYVKVGFQASSTYATNFYEYAYFSEIKDFQS